MKKMGKYITQRKIGTERFMWPPSGFGGILKRWLHTLTYYPFKSLNPRLFLQ